MSKIYIKFINCGLYIKIQNKAKYTRWVSLLWLLGCVGMLVRIAEEVYSALRFSNTGVSSMWTFSLTSKKKNSFKLSPFDMNSHRLHQAIFDWVRILHKMHRTKHRCLGWTVSIFLQVVHEARLLSKNSRKIEWKLV